MSINFSYYSNIHLFIFFLIEDTLQFLPSLIYVAKGQQKLINGVNKEREERLSTILS